MVTSNPTMSNDEPGARVLVVEDEPKVAAFVSEALSEFGFRPHSVASGEEGLDELSSNSYDALILDVMLPGMDGFELLKRAKQGGVQVPTILLTARDALDDRVTGLDLGADDYLPKPFELAELMARLRAILRRHSSNLKWLTIGDLTLDPVSRTVTRNHKRVDLTAREFSLLELMMRNRGRTMSRNEIMQVVWDDPHAASNVIPVYINYLRAKIEGSGKPRLIHTVRGIGYVLELRDAHATESQA